MAENLALSTRMGHCFSLSIGRDGIAQLVDPSGECFNPPHETHLELVYIPKRKRRGMLKSRFLWIEELVGVPELEHISRGASRTSASRKKVPLYEYSGAIFKIVPESSSSLPIPYTKPREMFMGMHVDTPDAMRRHRQALRDERLIHRFIIGCTFAILGVLVIFRFL